MFRLILIAAILLSNFLLAQTGSVSGIVTGSGTGEGLAGVNIIFSDPSFNITTDRDGFFSARKLPPGEYVLVFSHIGFRNETANVIVNAGTEAELNITMTPAVIKLGEVNVISPRYMKMIKDVALPMAVVESDDIISSPSATPSDLLNKQPGITLARDGIWGTHISIRGLSRSSLVTMVDGNRIETATDLAAGLSMIDLNDVKRIEVIKGAASSLYGTGGMGGVVNIITKDDGYNSSFSINGSVTSGFNSVNDGRTGSISLSSGSINWFAKLTGTLRKANDAKTPDGTIKNSRFSDEYFSVYAGYKPFDNNEFRINYQRFYAKDVGIPGGAPLFPDKADVRYPFEQRDLFSAEYFFRRVFESSFNFSLKYYNQNIYRDVENIPYIVQNVPAGGGQPPRRINVLKILPNARHYTNGVVAQATGLIGTNHLLIAGVDIWQRELDSRRQRHLKIEVLDSTGTNVVNTINQIIGERPLPESKYLSMGFFIQDEFSALQDKLTLTIGGRIDRINVQNKQVSNPVYLVVNGNRNDNPSNSVLQWEAEKVHDISWSANAGILYKLFRNIDVSFNAARSFRSPGLEERYQFIDLGSLVRLGDPNLKPERGSFFDLGLRIWQPSYSFNLSIFLNLMEDLVAEIPGTYENKNALIKTNIGKARLYGFDLGFEGNLYNGFVVYGNAAFVRGEDTGNNSDLPQIPPFNGMLGVRLPVMDYLNVDLSASFFADQKKTAAGEIATPGYAYFDLLLSSQKIDVGAVSFRLFAGAENLTNRSYRNHLSTNRGFILSEPGRNIFARINISW